MKKKNDILIKFQTNTLGTLLYRQQDIKNCEFNGLFHFVRLCAQNQSMVYKLY